MIYFFLKYAREPDILVSYWNVQLALGYVSEEFFN